MLSHRAEDVPIHQQSIQKRREAAFHLDEWPRVHYFDSMTIQDLITVDPDILGGEPVFKGTRIPVKALFENLEDGASIDDFIEWFPGVTRQQVQGILECAAQNLPRPLAA